MIQLGFLKVKSITDPANHLFWEERYQAGNRPWETYGIPAIFNDVLSLIKPVGRVLIPGCGSAYEMKMFNYADRQIIFSIFPLLSRELGFSKLQLRLIGSPFMWIYACGFFVAGFLADRCSRKSLIFGGLLLLAAFVISRKQRSSFLESSLCF